MVYVPRLAFADGGVSKTQGNFKLAQFRRAGIDPRDVVDYLAYDCLVDGLVWRIDNVKPNPVLGAWAEEMLHAVHP
jgi:hypothetical protein